MQVSFFGLHSVRIDWTKHGHRWSFTSSRGEVSEQDPAQLTTKHRQEHWFPNTKCKMKINIHVVGLHQAIWDTEPQELQPEMSKQKTKNGRRPTTTEKHASVHIRQWMWKNQTHFDVKSLNSVSWIWYAGHRRASKPKTSLRTLHKQLTHISGPTDVPKNQRNLANTCLCWFSVYLNWKPFIYLVQCQFQPHESKAYKNTIREISNALHIDAHSQQYVRYICNML